jgi:hypothetical protein
MSRTTADLGVTHPDPPLFKSESPFPAGSQARFTKAMNLSDGLAVGEEGGNKATCDPVCLTPPACYDLFIRHPLPV